MPHEQLEQRELLRRQLDRLAGPVDVMGRRIEAEVAHLQDRRPLHGSASNQRPDAREQLHEVEGFGEVVVRAHVEAGHPVVDRSLAVSISTGLHRSASRNRRHTSKPSMSGSITSSTTTS